jgi:site-specific DNA-methyltransferase (adenine-specific)
MNDIFNDNVSLKTETPAFAKHVLPAVPSSEVYLEDCVTALKRFNDNHFDLAIVDPPYTDEVAGLKVGFNSATDRADFSFEHFKQPKKEYFDQLFRVSKNQIIWGFNYFLELLPNTNYVIVWNKYQKAHFNECEVAWSSLKKSKVFERNFEKDMKNKIHPTQKPVALYDWILHHYAQPNDLILDTHLGSGSSRIAAYKGGFNFIGFEIDPEYYEKQEKRFNDWNSQLRMF